jgi:hypothetical protein
VIDPKLIMKKKKKSLSFFVLDDSTKRTHNSNTPSLFPNSISTAARGRQSFPLPPVVVGRFHTTISRQRRHGSPLMCRCGPFAYTCLWIRIRHLSRHRKCMMIPSCDTHVWYDTSIVRPCLNRRSFIRLLEHKHVTTCRSRLLERLW